MLLIFVNLYINFLHIFTRLFNHFELSNVIVQMGTGFVAATKLSPDGKTVLPAGPIILSGPLSQPDLLTDHNSSLVRDHPYMTSCFSIN